MRGTDWARGPLETILPAARFDLLIMNQVLEHLPRPSQTLREARRVLRPGGLLYLTVPNYGSMESRLFGKDWDALKIPEHLHHYTRATLLRLLDDSGFEIRMCRTDSISAVTLASMRNWSADRAPRCQRWARAVATAIRPAVMLCDVLGQGSILRVLAKRQ